MYEIIRQVIVSGDYELSDMIDKIKKNCIRGDITDEQETELIKQPTGAHDAYHRGDGITWTDGKKYDCIAPDGVAVVWNPDEYPAYWQLVEEEV